MRAARQRRPLLLIGAACAAFLGGMAARGLVSVTVISNVHHGGDAHEPSGLSEPTTRGPATYTDGIPGGFARSADGARAAAVAYVLTGQVLIGQPAATVEAAVRVISATASATRQVTSTARQLDELRSVLAPGVDGFAPDRVHVSVWNVGVLSRVGVASPQAAWAISVFDLVWERGEWKVQSETITPGPAPALNASVAPATSETLAAALDGFTPWTSSP
jgi:hypothetical protein